MSKPRILFVGEHPLGTTGNCGMMNSLLSDIDTDKFDISCLAAGEPAEISSLLFHKIPFSIVNLVEESNFWGQNKLRSIIQQSKFDILLMVGIDLWRYIEIFDDLIKMRDGKKFKFGAIFPYDLVPVRSEIVDMCKRLDFPCVYSEYGYDKLKGQVSHLQYFKPPLHMSEIWKPITNEDKMKIREDLFRSSGISEDIFMIGFIGANQQRKDPQKLIKAFSVFNAEFENSVLYMHTEKALGVFNIPQCVMDYGIKPGKVLTKPDRKGYPLIQMPKVYGVFDVYVNCSIQEGLSWTVIESMLCGIPPIISDTTAHKELAIDENLLVPCDTPTQILIKAKTGQTWVDGFCCRSEDIYEALKWFYSQPPNVKEELREKSINKGNEWISGCSDINDLLEEVIKTKSEAVKTKVGIGVGVKEKNAILFAQHSAAGDVLMTTRCFKGLKERHKGLDFHYMTQKKYHDIVEGNPYIDKIVDWDPLLFQKGVYMYVYNPHGDIILPGHWGRNCNSILSDFYWKLLRVEPDDFFIEQKESEDVYHKIQDKVDIAIVHTTGGDSNFRTYKYMADVSYGLKGRGFYVIQLGGARDFPAGADLDLRGKLSFRESAWVMSKARIAVTVDSFISHLAGALGIDQIVLYGSGNYVVVQPKMMKSAVCIHMVPNYVRDCKGLGPCSASVRDCPAPCTGRHDPKLILEAVGSLVQKQRGFYEMSGVEFKTIYYEMDSCL
uniref:Putative glycosyltransferase n=1 Tax=viral metagenome TaxID=1070528 RepID=A0A6M3J6Q9_9ZZZZ